MMPRQLRRSLRFRLIAACVLIEAVMLPLIIGNSIRLVEQHLVQLAQGRVRNMEQTFGISLAAPLAARDHAVLRSLIERLTDLDGIVYLALADDDGVVVASGGQVPTTLPEPDASFTDAAPVHHARSDIALYGQPLGQLHYGVATQFLQVAKRELLIQGIAIAVLEIFFSSFALVTVGVLLTARLEALTDASLRMAGGDYDTLVAVRGEDEVASLARAFNSMAGAVSDKVAQLEASGAVLRASNAELLRLSEVTAHHLQEPVRGIANFAQLLANRARDRLDGDALDYLNYIIAGAKRARGLLTDLQSYVAIDMSPVPAGLTADLAQCAERAQREMRSKIETSGAHLSIDELPRVHGDADQIVMVLRLLMENAIDHRGDATPEVRVTACADEGRVVVSVADNGPGVPSEFRERVFALFETLDRRTTGTGVGLAAVRKIVRRHLGNVWITPAGAGAGLVVHFTLPKAGPSDDVRPIQVR